MNKLFANIRARVEAATPGPWINKRWNDDAHIKEASKPDDYQYIAKTGGWEYSYLHKNADFIAASRTDIPKLLEAIDIMQEALEHIYESAQKGDGTITECEMAYSADDALERARALSEGGEK